MIIDNIIKKSCASLFVLGVLYAYGADATANWTLSEPSPKGDASGTLATMLAAPATDPKVIYLSSFLNDGPIFYESTDDCKTWQPAVKEGLPTDTAVSLGSAVTDGMGNIYSVVANTNPLNAAQDTVFELPIGQKTWIQKTIVGLPVGWQISALAVDSSYAIYAAMISSDLQSIAIYKLGFGAKNWIKQTVPSLENMGSPFMITALEIDKAGDLFAAIENAGVYKLTAGNNTWSELNDGLPVSTTTNPVFLMQLLPDSNNNLYLVSNYGVFKLASGSTTWVTENQGLDDVIAEAQQSANIETLSLSITGNGALYLQTPKGVMYLQNDDVWNSVPVDGVLPFDIYAIATNNNDKLCVSTSKGVFVQN